MPKTTGEMYFESKLKDPDFLFYPYIYPQLYPASVSKQQPLSKRN